MMSTTAVEFEAQYTSELIDEASLAFVRHYLFQRYGRWLKLACIINAAGLALVLWFGVEPLLVIPVVAIAVLGPLYLAVVYFAYPAKFANRIKQFLLTSARFSLSAREFEVRTTAGSARAPWPKAGSLLECSSFWLLALTPFAFVIFPKASLPPAAVKLLQQKRSSGVA